MKQVPVCNVEASTLAEAYEQALISTYKNGIDIKTQYDGENPPSKDCTINITVLNPDMDPIIHKAFPGGIEDLREYVLELEGMKDHWTKNIDDPNDNRWEYTYHQRLAKWGSWKGGSINEPQEMCITGSPINQIQQVINKLIKQPFTRQAQMITWMPFIDSRVYDPPCLQSIWYRLLEDEGMYYLNCNVRFRSNDAWGAFFMNAFGIIQFNKEIICRYVGEELNSKIELGRLNWQADSFHIYGKDLKDFEERFYNKLDKPFDTRTYNFYDDMIQEIYYSADSNILEKIKKYDENNIFL